MTALRRWWPLLALLALAFNLRPVAVSIGPVLTEISRDVGLDGVTAGLLTSLPTLCFAFFGAVAPWAARRFGAHRAILVSIIALMVGQGGRLLVEDPVPFLLLSVLALGGMAQANVLLPSLVRRHYPSRVGLATALYSLVMTVGVTLASTATVPLAHALGGHHGPRNQHEHEGAHHHGHQDLQQVLQERSQGAYLKSPFFHSRGTEPDHGDRGDLEHQNHHRAHQHEQAPNLQ